MAHDDTVGHIPASISGALPTLCKNGNVSLHGTMEPTAIFGLDVEVGTTFRRRCAAPLNSDDQEALPPARSRDGQGSPPGDESPALGLTTTTVEHSRHLGGPAVSDDRGLLQKRA
jgi:hypothetical protein